MEGPVRWHFCDNDCAAMWAVRRAERGWCTWFRICAGDRAQVPIEERYGALTDCGLAPSDLRDLHNFEVSVPETERLPQD